MKLTSFEIQRVAVVIIYTTIVWKLASFFGNENNGKNGMCAEERLEESKKNYERAVKARHDLERSRPMDESNKWSWKNGMSIWDFFYATFDCPHTVERIGNSGDGGKWICGLNHIAKKSSPCIVYSYGVSNEFSFEEMVLERTHCSVYMFDHTIDISKINLTEKYPERVFIQKKGLGVEDKGDVMSLKSQMKENGHEHLDILKVDVEGAERTITNNWKNDFPLGLPFSQLALEIHVNRDASQGFYATFKNWFENLESMGLRPYRNEYNLLGTRGGQPLFIEYSYINIKTDNWLLHSS